MMFQIAAFGNPLLDITVQIPNNELLKKYNLNEDDQIDIPADKMKPLYEDIKTLTSHTSPGGCAQNSIRVLQWLLQEPNSTIFFGGIGNDEQGVILSELVQKTGVTTKYFVHKNHSTGTCIVLVNGPKRTPVAHLGAAEHYSINALTPEILNILKTVPLCYVEGYFLINRLDTAEYILNFCMKNKTEFVFNLCGAYLIRKYPKQVLNFARNCDILIGNQIEFSTLGECMDIREAQNVAISLSKTSNKPQKIVVMTNGPKNVLCFHNNGEILDLKVPKIPLEKLKDTTGAGDSFLAGFLAAFLLKKDLEKCVKLGIWTATQIIQENGCTIPNFIPQIEEILEN